MDEQSIIEDIQRCHLYDLDGDPEGERRGLLLSWKLMHELAEPHTDLSTLVGAFDVLAEKAPQALAWFAVNVLREFHNLGGGERAGAQLLTLPESEIRRLTEKPEGGD